MHGSTFIFYFIRIAMILGHFKFPAFTVPSRLLYLKIVVLFAENVKARLKVGCVMPTGKSSQKNNYLVA